MTGKLSSRFPFLRRPATTALSDSGVPPSRKGTLRSGLRAVLTSLLALVVLLGISRFLSGQLRPPKVSSAPYRGTVTVGWESYYPYQFEKSEGRLSGVDTELLRVAFDRAGYRLRLVEQDWAGQQEDLREGRLQCSSLALRTEERESFAYLSAPYLKQRVAAYYRRPGMLPRNCRELRDLCASRQLSVGCVRGYAYPDEIEQLLRADDVQPRVVYGRFEVESLQQLVDGRVDVVLADELAGTSLMLKNGWGEAIGCTVLDLPARDVHILFSRKSASPEMVEQFNEALRAMEADGTKAAIVRSYYYPIQVGLLTRTFWFEDISVLAAGAAAILGIFLAQREGYNLVGAFLMASAPAAGGGLLRDLISGRRPVGVMADPAILGTVALLVMVGFVGFRLLARFSRERYRRLDELDLARTPVILFCESLGLAAYTIVGVLVALDNHCEPLWLWGPILAALSNGGGSILRDLIRHRNVAIVTSPTPYPEIAAVWGLLLSLYLISSSRELPISVVPLEIAMGVTMLGVALTRVAVLRFNLRSPFFRPELPEGE